MFVHMSNVYIYISCRVARVQNYYLFIFSPHKRSDSSTFTGLKHIAYAASLNRRPGTFTGACHVRFVGDGHSHRLCTNIVERLGLVTLAVTACYVWIDREEEVPRRLCILHVGYWVFVTH